MKHLCALLTFICVVANTHSQTNLTTKNQFKMKLNAGIVTAKLKETKDFYINNLGFGVSFENEFYLLLHTPNKEAEISFCFQIIQVNNRFFNNHLKAKECI